MLTSGSLSSSTSRSRRPAARIAIARLAVAGEPQPQPVGEVGVELGRLEAHLRCHVAGPLGAVHELVGGGGVEADDGVGAQRAVLGRPEREHVDAGPPRQLGRGAPERGDACWRCGRRPCARAANGRGRRRRWPATSSGVYDVPWSVGQRERHHRRLGVVRVAPAGRVERRRHRVRRQPERRTGQPAHHGAAAEQRRRPTLAVEDVGRLVAQHGAPRRAQRRQPERVGRRAADDREHRDVGVLEDVGDPLAQPRRPLVGAVGEGRALVGGGDGGEDLRRHAGGVVAAQLDRTVHAPVSTSGPGGRARPSVTAVTCTGRAAILGRSAPGHGHGRRLLETLDELGLGAVSSRRRGSQVDGSTTTCASSGSTPDTC